MPSGYPFGTGDWERWTNRKRLDWLINFRQKSRDKYKSKFSITDDEIAQMSADIKVLENAVLAEDFNAAQASARNAPTPRESAKMLGELIDDICANDYYKARRLGLSGQAIEKMRTDADRYLSEIDEWERKQNARNILGFSPPKRKPVPKVDDDTPESVKLRAFEAFRNIDDSKLKAAIQSGDKDAVDREFKAWTAQLEAIAAKDPVVGKWFDAFCAEQERLLRWDDTINE